MLRKLLKYDFLSIARLGWIILPVMAIITFCATICTNLVRHFSALETGWEAIPFGIGMIGLIVCIYGVGLCGIALEILMIVRFYKNFYTDEGYLTFTLPVKKKTLLFSKTLNALLCYAIFFGLVVGSIIFVILFGGFPIMETLPDILAFLKAEWIWVALYIIEGIFLIFCLSFMSVSMIYFSMAIGCTIVKKAKFLCAIGICILADIAVSIVLPSNLISYGYIYMIYSGKLSTAIGMMVYSLIYLILGLVFYNITLSRLTRRLNVD